jgi:hypothetical protein
LECSFFILTTTKILENPLPILLPGQSKNKGQRAKAGDHHKAIAFIAAACGWRYICSFDHYHHSHYHPGSVPAAVSQVSRSDLIDGIDLRGLLHAVQVLPGSAKRMVPTRSPDLAGKVAGTTWRKI